MMIHFFITVITIFHLCVVFLNNTTLFVLKNYLTLAFIHSCLHNHQKNNFIIINDTKYIGYDIVFQLTFHKKMFN